MIFWGTNNSVAHDAALKCLKLPVWNSDDTLSIKINAKRGSPI